MIRRTCSVAVLATALLSACATPLEAQQATTMQTAHAGHAIKASGPRDLSVKVAPEDVGFDSARLKLFDDYMANAVSTGRVAGMTTFLARHGKVVSFKTYGLASQDAGTPIKEDTIFRIYSMTKPITGVAMMILFEQGKWRLDDPVTRY
ncbi:MAG: class A beta-lactamase-related serine hydrolase, partial [Alphaproteobacteria bacterium]